MSKKNEIERGSIVCFEHNDKLALGVVLAVQKPQQIPFNATSLAARVKVIFPAEEEPIALAGDKLTFLAPVIRSRKYANWDVQNFLPEVVLSLVSRLNALEEELELRLSAH